MIFSPALPCQINAELHQGGGSFPSSHSYNLKGFQSPRHGSDCESRTQVY